MSELKILKRKLSKLMRYKNNLPRLIDCSEVYGDLFYTKEDLLNVQEEINKVTEQIKEIKSNQKDIIK